MYSVARFEPEGWMGPLADKLPATRVSLARLPTPVHRLTAPDGLDVDIFVKRDDLTSFDLSGNKVRKLEFLLADALEKGCDSVVTIGGVQSNHCRATAVAARQLGMEPYLILRTSDPSGIDLTGNLLFSRMVGAQIYTVTPEEYYARGSDAIVKAFADHMLQTENKRCYPIPCGGSNALGTFGYINAVAEMIRGCVLEDGSFPYQHIVFGCGSGGTAAGLAIGVHLSGLKTKVHAVGVCDTPDEFYDVVCSLAVELGLTGQDSLPLSSEDVRGWLEIYNGQGLGYAMSTDEELKFLMEVGCKCGIGFDPVYSGKALYVLFNMIREEKSRLPTERIFPPGDKILFIHTGGFLGLYDKVPQLLPLIQSAQEIKLFSTDSTA